MATVAFELASCVLSWGLEPRYDTLLYALYAVVQAGAGALIATRHPRNPIGWLFLGFALFECHRRGRLAGLGPLRRSHGLARCGGDRVARLLELDRRVTRPRTDVPSLPRRTAARTAVAAGRVGERARHRGRAAWMGVEPGRWI